MRNLFDFILNIAYMEFGKLLEDTNLMGVEFKSISTILLNNLFFFFFSLSSLTTFILQHVGYYVKKAWTFRGKNETT
jgi:hypothetical protein